MTSSFYYILAAILVSFVLTKWFQAASESRKLSHIPASTSEYPLLSHLGALKFIINGNNVLQRGYEKYKGGIFKVPELFRWHILVTGRALVDELRKANESDLSMMEAVNDVLHGNLTLGRDLHENPYHIPIIRTYLTENIGTFYPDIRDEIVATSGELIHPSKYWTSYQASKIVMQLVCRTSNRIFVGLPLCRHSEFLQLNVDFTTEVVKAGYLLSVVPPLLREFVASLTPVEQIKQRAEELLRPIIQERLDLLQEHGDDWPEKPDDMLSRFIADAPKGDSTIRSVALRVLGVNFTAIHTSSTAFLNVLYHAAASPDFQAELRDEVDNVVAEYGWNKESLARMVKIDSFIKETGRYESFTSISLMRKAMKDFTFSNGTLIPKGTLLSTTSRAAHFDEGVFKNAHVFDPWRFVKTVGEHGASAAALRNQFINTSPELLTFGSGKHACPGRFFASIELKTMLAHLVYTYDMKMEKEGIVPTPTFMTLNVIPDQTAAVMFRKRKN